MAFKLEWKIFGCEMWSIILWNAFCAAIPMIWVTYTHLTGYVLRRKVPKNWKSGTSVWYCSHMFNLISFTFERHLFLRDFKLNIIALF